MLSVHLFPDTNTEVSSFVDETAQRTAWFHAGQLGEVLEFTTPSRYLPTVLAEHEYKDVKFNPTGRPSLFVREEAVYILIMRSKSVRAERFQHWLAYEVLPSLRKTGSYGKTQEQSEKTLEEFERLGIIQDLRSTQRSLIASLNHSLENEGSHEQLNAIAANLEAVRKAMQDVPVPKPAPREIKNATKQSPVLQYIKELALKAIAAAEPKGATFRDLYRAVYAIKTSARAIEVVEALESEGLVRVETRDNRQFIHIIHRF